jgi:hypothetical protein
MGALFTSASSQRLVNSAPPLITYPFTVGLWVFTPTGATFTPWSLAAVANTTHFFSLSWTTGAPGVTSINAAAGGATAAGSTSTPQIPTSRWVFMIGRFINATNRRLAFMITGSLNVPLINHGSNVTSTSPVVDTGYIGCRGGSTPSLFHNGLVAEYWMTDTDIQPDGLQLSNETVRHLARRGPFSLPHIASRVIDYRSFRTAVSSNEDCAPDYFVGSKGRQNWVNVNGVIRGVDMPYGENYQRPGDYTIPGVF